MQDAQTILFSKMGGPMSSNAPRVGDELCFEYPAANYIFARQRYEPRWLRVDRIDPGPAPQSAIDADPLLRREGWLVTGRDWTRGGATRSFYLGAARSVRILRETEGEFACLGGICTIAYTSAGQPLPHIQHDAVRGSVVEGERIHQAPSPVMAAGEGADVMESERLYRVSVIRPNGQERMLAPCLPKTEAEGFIRGYNSAADITGVRAIAREVELPRLKRNAASQLQ